MAITTDRQKWEIIFKELIKLCRKQKSLIDSLLQDQVYPSPDGCTVASAAGDETLRFWNVFGTPEAAKPAPKAAPQPFADMNRIRIR